MKTFLIERCYVPASAITSIVHGEYSWTIFLSDGRSLQLVQPFKEGRDHYSKVVTELCEYFGIPTH